MIRAARRGVAIVALVGGLAAACPAGAVPAADPEAPGPPAVPVAGLDGAVLDVARLADGTTWLEVPASEVVRLDRIDPDGTRHERVSEAPTTCGTTLEAAGAVAWLWRGAGACRVAADGTRTAFARDLTAFSPAPDGTAWAVAGAEILHLLADGTTTARALPGGADPTARVGIGPDGRPWVVGRAVGGAVIRRVAADDTVTTVWTGTGLGDPLALLDGGDGTAWVFWRSTAPGAPGMVVRRVTPEGSASEVADLPPLVDGRRVVVVEGRAWFAVVDTVLDDLGTRDASPRLVGLGADGFTQEYPLHLASSVTSRPDPVFDVRPVAGPGGVIWFASSALGRAPGPLWQIDPAAEPVVLAVSAATWVAPSGIGHLALDIDARRPGGAYVAGTVDVIVRRPGPSATDAVSASLPPLVAGGTRVGGGHVDAAHHVLDIVMTTGWSASPTAPRPRIVFSADAPPGDGAQARVAIPPWSSSTTPAQARAMALHRKLLGRTPGESAWSYWSGTVAARGLSSAASAMVATGEYRARELAAIYQRVLGRPLDPGGRAYWLGRWGPGFGRTDAAAALLGSSEVYAKAGGTPTGWADATYRAVLGRGADPGGRAWLARSAGTVAARTSAARALALTAEGRRVRLDRIAAEVQLDPGSLRAELLGALGSAGSADEAVVVRLLAATAAIGLW